MVKNPLVGKRIYLDANPIIYALENPSGFPGLITHLLEPLNRSELTVVTSSITLTEVLTHPIKSGDAALENAYRRFLTPAEFVEVLSVDTKIAEYAATLRAKFGLRTPDAIHVSTAILANCDLILTRDSALTKVGLKVGTPESL